MATQRVIILAIAAASLVSMACAISGTATFYIPPYIPSACFGNVDQGTMIAAANRDLYNNGAACGQSYTVTCTGANCRNGAVTVRIVDLCPGCGPNQLDLSQEAFAIIADPNAGRIQIDYTPA
ncbi:Putative EG45-like domain containing protein 1 [Striga hermonthica]|uniref:EG45-like domain containing protein 1 n=1 Tax=Striga hermonthica TaxID=68872 RepID=A0A9N7MFN5_STRHE|nr:Putative EG45-like domain containing protein 1 [Striga hermonthica]